ncbi:Myb-like_DNA-binding domain-containing protein [Hexamita inflata]|uniref:Myb-like DNA-binding domain-containing protein n=1 Tax=Hexamita inflata TaxID=28002 RepID=A0AA86TKT1_9EUKA|nr:Myb-like DNA-binding domain-containing protein [Hexamita inflata]
MNKREYKKWTDEDRDKLVGLVKSNVSSTGRIYWDIVCSKFSNRTILQCKNYYQNIIRPNLPEEINKNKISINKPSNIEIPPSIPVKDASQTYKSNSCDSVNMSQDQLFDDEQYAWTNYESIRLTGLITLYGSDIEKLHIFFQNRTKDELKKCIQWQLQQMKQYHDLFQSIMNGIYFNQSPSQAELRIVVGIIRVIQYRCLVINMSPDSKFPEIPQNVIKLVQSILGTEIDSLVTLGHTDFVESALFGQIDLEFGLVNLVNKLPLIEELYKKLYGNDIYYE